MHTVIAVEDDSQFRDTLAEVILNASGLELLGVASNIKDGVSLLGELCPDILLVDLNLPDGDGVDLIHQALERCPNCRPVVITALDDDKKVHECLEAGAFGYILKTSRLEALTDHIRLVAEGYSIIGPGVAGYLKKVLQKDVLSRQETNVIELILRGYKTEEIAKQMGISKNTVNEYSRRIFEKLHVKTRAAAVAAWLLRKSSRE